MKGFAHQAEGGLKIPGTATFEATDLSLEEQIGIHRKQPAVLSTTVIWL